MEQLAVGEKYISADKHIQRALVNYYDLYKKEIRDGREHYSLFHRKGNPLNQQPPEYLYILEKDIVQGTQLPDAVEQKYNPAKPTGYEATLLITKNFESKVLSNRALDTQQKIEMTVHCSCQALKSLFRHGAVASNDFEVIRQIGYSFLCFTEMILQENEAVETLVQTLMGTSRNEYTHAVHVSLYSGMLASELYHQDLLKLDNKRLTSLYIGTLLHDLGKIKVQQEILQKRGQLSRDEYKEVKKHPRYGYELVENIEIPKEAKDIIRYHHEKWEGGGYPYNISYQAISPLVRIASICDVFDALSSRRKYRPGYSPFQSLVMMRKMTGAFYTRYLNAFIRFLGRGSAC